MTADFLSEKKKNEGQKILEQYIFRFRKKKINIDFYIQQKYPSKAK